MLPSHKKPIHPTWLSQNPTKVNSFCNQTFHTSFWMHFWQFPTKIAQKPWLHLFTNFVTKAQKSNPPNLAKPKPNQVQFLLQPNFWHVILDAFVAIPHQDCSKTMTSLIHQFFYQGTKTRSNDQTWLSQNPNKINSFCNQTFHTSFCKYICDSSKPRLLKNHDITFSPILLPRLKKPIHPTWLSQNPTKFNSFCNQTFDTLFWMHLWQFPTKIAQKLWLHLFTNFATKAQKLGQTTKLG